MLVNKFHVIDGDDVHSSLAVFETADYMLYSCLHNLKQYACHAELSCVVGSQV